jgi:sodium/potassium-transporting ATPase subunit beta
MTTKGDIADEVKEYDFRNKPPPFSLAKFCYNPNEGSFCGRTLESWIKIGIFYTIFYGCLAALVAICMWVFFQTLDPRIPKWKLNESIIGTNPGLGFRPHPPDDNVESTLIWYNGTKKEDFQHWQSSLDKFLSEYKTPGTTAGRGQNIHNCNYNMPPPVGGVCNVNILEFGTDCTQENHYGYHKTSPCIFLKLNKIYGWVPEYFGFQDDLPAKMPQTLKEQIRHLNSTNPKQLETVWVTCEGENPADVENIGPIDFKPRQGFAGYYFPYMNSEGYLSPLVAIHFQRPVKGIIINVECKAWAKNIRHDRKDRIGSVHFEIMID